MDYFCSILFDEGSVEATEYAEALEDRVKQENGTELPVKSFWRSGKKSVYDDLIETIHGTKYLVILYNQAFLDSDLFQHCDDLVHKVRHGNKKTIDIVVGIQGFTAFPVSLRHRKPIVFKNIRDENSWKHLLHDLKYEPGKDKFTVNTNHGGSISY